MFVCKYNYVLFHFLSMKGNDFTCKVVMPGIGCGTYESIVLSIAFFIGAIFCSISLYYIIFKFHSVQFSSYQRPFWISFIIWFIYRGIIAMFPFNYSPISYRVVCESVESILFFIPVSTAILLILNLLFKYSSPGAKIQLFFKILFFVFLILFCTIGIMLSVVDAHDYLDPGNSIDLWVGCTDFLIMIFAFFPALKLIQIIHEIGSDSFLKCSFNGKICLFLFAILYLIRSLWFVLTFAGVNPVETWIKNNSGPNIEHISAGARAFKFLFYVLCDLVPSMLVILGVTLIIKNSTALLDDPFFVRPIPSEQSIYIVN